MGEEKIYDCIIIGGGPGGLQAAIYLGRYNRDVLLIDRGGGRTWHAKHIENFLTQKVISGEEIIRRGVEQARSFNVRIERGQVTRVMKRRYFEVSDGENLYLSKFVIASSGVRDDLPPVENLHRFLGVSFFTCLDCDGYRTTNKKLVIIGNSLETANLAFAMKAMYTEDITLILYSDRLPEEYKEELRDEHIRLIIGRPVKIIGGETMEAVELRNGERIACEVVMSHFGFTLNDEFLGELGLKRDSDKFKYVVSHAYESSLSGLYIVGPLNTGDDQVVVAAGEGAVAALDIKKRLLELEG
ncbi:MAG TPA: NAD(P)/FAD-dependent oxidoreductase [Thermodesulfovibrionales bacterium]|nr:NAD(P)/FAD-dependent oxidoreductase [Thermodesulfovibrionales bacterium]